MTMKGERILIADDELMAREGLQRLIEVFGKKDGHKIVGVAGSVGEVATLVESGVRPTVALVDNKFPAQGDGEKAMEIIKNLSPDTLVISFSGDINLTWGDENWLKNMPAKKLIEQITDLKH